MSGCSDMINQIHSGVGHNVGRDQHLHVYSTLAPADIRGQVDLVLDRIRENDHAQADMALTVLKSGTALNSESRAVLDMLSVHLGLSRGKELEGAHKLLIKHLGSLQNDIAKDLCFAVLVRFECRFGRENDAKKRCERQEDLGVYAREVFYELVLSAEGLSEVFRERELDLTEGEITGVVNGALRLDALDLAALALTRLESDYPSSNCAVLKLYLRALALNPVLIKGQYWCSNKRINNELIAVAQECSDLISAGKGEDARLFNVAIPVLSYLLYSHESLLKACWKYKDKVEEVNKEFAAELYLRVVGDYSKFTGVRLELHESENDENKKRLVLARILPLLRISVEELPLLLALSSKDQLGLWFANGGVCTSDELIEVDSANLLIAISLYVEGDHEAKERVRSQAEKFYNRHVGGLAGLSQFFIDNVTSSFFEIGFSDLACNYLEVMLPKKDFWFSPLFSTYVNSLLSALRKKTLLEVLNSIDKDDWTEGVWIIKANLDLSLGNYLEAFVSVKSALKIDFNNIEFWCFAFRLTRDCKNLLDDPLFIDLPEELFSKLSIHGLQLLHELVRINRFKYVEAVLIKWFVSSPHANAKPISDFYYGTLLALPFGSMANVSETSGDVIAAVEYTSGRDSYTRLVVSGEQASNEFCINSNSSLAKELLDRSPGEVFHNGMNEVVLVERLMPYVAVLRMATEIRLRQNDGADIFYKLETPSAPEELLPFMEATLRRQEMQSTSFGFDSDVNIPICMKGFKRFPNEPVKAAIQQFSHKDAYRHSILAIGDEEPKCISIDIYTICYISLIGFSSVLLNRFDCVYVSSSTKKALEDWLATVSDERYLTLALAPNGRLIRTTSADIKNSDQTFFEGMRAFSERVKILKPVIFDVPSEIMMVREFIDATVFSTMHLSLENDVSWFCIDNQIGALYKTSGGRVVNAQRLLIELGVNESYESRKIGFQMYAQGTVPYVCTWRDFHLMAMSSDHLSANILAKILRLENSFDLTNPENYTRLAGVVAQSILNSLSFEGNNIYSHIYNETEVCSSSSVVNAALYKVLRHAEKGAEDKFADFYLTVLELFQNSSLLRELVEMLFVRFMKENFLDPAIVADSLARLLAERKKITLE